MLTSLQGKRLPYTYKEIVESCHPEFWNAATECINRVNGWQQMIVELLPKWKTIIHNYSKQRNSENAQIALLNYLKLRSIYGFAHLIWKQVNHTCHDLGVSSNNSDQDDIDQAQTKLISLFESFENVDVFDISQDETAGFEKLEQAVAGFGTRTDFQVMYSLWFLDIVGTIKNGNPWPDHFWELVLNDSIPTAPNVGGLMESEEDNKIVRIY